jgi:hypothetical protein
MSDWRDEAACLNDWEPFDATEPSEKRLSVLEKGRIDSVAKSICYSCDVKTDCLAEALRLEIPSTTYHVRGGLTAEERRELLQRLSRKRTKDKRKAQEDAA